MKNNNREKILNTVGFTEEVKSVKLGKCPFCKNEIRLNDFRDYLSLDEYNISGLCQKCQDEVFGKEVESEV